MRVLKSCVMAVFIAGLAAPVNAGKPERDLLPVNLEFTGGEVEGAKESFGDVTRTAKKGITSVVIVVRDMQVSVPAATAMDGGGICFEEPDNSGTPDAASAAGALTLNSDGTASFDLFANFETIENDLQSYNFFLDSTVGGQHTIDLTVDQIAGTVSFDRMDVDTEGRGKKPKSCRGEVDVFGTGLEITGQ